MVLAEGMCEILGSGFRTTRVRNGGKAIIWLELTQEPESYRITDENGNEVTDFDVLAIGEDSTDGVIYRYLKFTVNSDGAGTTTYPVTVDDGEKVYCTLNIWQEKR